MRIVFLLIICSQFCQAQGKLSQTNKITPALLHFVNQNSKPDSIDIVFSYKDQFSFSQWKNKVKVNGGYSRTNVIVGKIKSDSLVRFINDSTIKFIDLHRKPKEELPNGDFDLTLNKLNTVHHYFPTVNGDRIKTSIKEQRFDTGDVDFKGRYFSTKIAAPTRTTHASIMATILGGGGNSSPYSKGAAPGVFLTSSNFENLLPDADSIYERYNISVQNHSYGTGIENYYGADAAAYDANIYNHSSLVHIFSSGNSGDLASQSGTYSGIAGVANLTGSFKMAKNIITVGALDSFNNVMLLSSRGPAYDGRVKPELVAFGKEGSSGASALVSGAVALIQHAYLQIHDTLPSAALTKAILLNSASKSDENPISYSAGYGSLNAYKALEAVTGNHFFEGEIEKGKTEFFPVLIPSNVAQLKIMLVWNDLPAEANTPKALLNDLDATLYLPATGEWWLPWVLNPTASLDSLEMPATRKVDTLNNVEQITIDNPQPGNYSLEINGNKLKSLNQKFAVSYQFDSVTNFKWTYPTGSDVIEAGKSNILRWESNIQAIGTLEYSINSGPWQIAGMDIPIKDQLFKWIVEDSTNTAKLKFSIPSLGIVKESEEFIISQQTYIQVGFNCTDSFMLEWNSIPNRDYVVYQLGQKYMEPIANVSDTFIILQKQQHSSLHYASVPKIGNRHGLKSFAINYTTQGVDCYVRTFYAFPGNGTSSRLEFTLSSLHAVKQLSFQKEKGGTFQDIHTIEKPTNLFATYSDLTVTKGINHYRVVLTLLNGRKIYSPVEYVFYFPSNPVIVFPNPVRQSQPFRFIVRDPGVFTVNIYDATGKLFYRGALNDINHEISSRNFSKGIYLVKFYSKEGKHFVDKLVIY